MFYKKTLECSRKVLDGILGSYFSLRIYVLHLSPSNKRNVLQKSTYLIGDIQSRELDTGVHVRGKYKIFCLKVSDSAVDLFDKMQSVK